MMRTHPHLLGWVSVWRVTGRQDSNQENFVCFVAAISAEQAAKFCTDDTTDLYVTSVVEVSPLEFTGDVLKLAAIAYYKSGEPLVANYKPGSPA